MSRMTARTIQCDRCLVVVQVTEFSWRGLTPATLAGWSKYSTTTARTQINPHSYSDLCPDCSIQMRQAISMNINGMFMRIEYLSDDEIKAFRAKLTALAKQNKEMA